jgi:DNA-binding NarL/FixJ family response regulator
MTEPAAAEPIRVIVADDQTVVREALATLLGLMPGLDVVATAANGAEAVEAAGVHQPHVVLMDLRMPVMDGVEATRQITERHPEVAVLVLTTFADEDSILGALGAGARGYLTKESGRDDIAMAIRAAAAGQSVLDPQVQARLIAAASRPSIGRTADAGAGAGADAGADAGAETARVVPAEDPEPPDGLTPREMDVLRLIAEGLSNRAIAERLYVSEATVKTHINNLFAKAGLRDRAHAVTYAYRRGLVELPD